MATSLAQMTERAALTDACMTAADAVLARATDSMRGGYYRLTSRSPSTESSVISPRADRSPPR